MARGGDRTAPQGIFRKERKTLTLSTIGGGHLAHGSIKRETLRFAVTLSLLTLRLATQGSCSESE